MQLDESRRLTGPNLYAAAPGAIAEVVFEGGDDPAHAVALWREELGRALAALGWPADDVHVRHYRGGAALFFVAPLDALMPATEVNEWAVASAAARLAGGAPAPLPTVDLAPRPQLPRLAAAARARGVPLLIDDDEVTLGAGARLVRYPATAPLPAPDDVPWARLGTVPVALVTGTNGKTTTTRLVARMAQLAGRRPGLSSSDGVVVDGRYVERGDWSGPDAARRVLRHPDVDVAILETARGGILRRGLAVERCDAALITNVSVDHLGGYGVDDLATMARVKAVVARGAGTVIVNADDAALAALTFDAPVVRFSAAGAAGAAWRVVDGWIVHDGRPVIAVADVPLTFAGRARYNLENALAAAALATALGVPATAVVEGLRTFTSSARDNPGRGNVVERDGVQIVVDFGHNPAAVRGVIALARGLAPGRLFVSLGMAGDRPDDELAEVAREVAAGRPHRVLIRELADYLRGRAPGEVPARLVDDLIAAGVAAAAIAIAPDELATVRDALALARPGDVVVILCHLDAAVEAFLTPSG
ncbi:MAG: Mur ligase [Kofleriaceae bacterium]|nr:Mur ligase [Kofleriaceae bacterium]